MPSAFAGWSGRGRWIGRGAVPAGDVGAGVLVCAAAAGFGVVYGGGEVAAGVGGGVVDLRDVRQQHQFPRESGEVVGGELEPVRVQSVAAAGGVGGDPV